MSFGPLGDLAMIKIASDEYGFGQDDRGTAESGILIELPTFTHYGMWSFAFEGSLANGQVLKELEKHWQGHIGHRVYWTALSEKGNIINRTNANGVKERFAFVKFTSLIACESDPGVEGENAHSEGAGSFNMAEGIE